MAVILFFLIGYAVFLYFFARLHWWQFKNQPNPPNFTYSITDIWTAIVGLTPTLALTAYAIEQSGYEEFPLLLIGAASVGAGQLAGIFTGKLATLRPPPDGELFAGNMRSARDIFLGACIGVALPVFFLIIAVFLIWAVLFCLMLFFMAPAAGSLFLCFFLLVVALIVRERRRRDKT